jgi:hypothetical protein
MKNVTIATAKEIREQIGATRLVLFAIAEDGTQHVVTHGKTQIDAKG